MIIKGSSGSLSTLDKQATVNAFFTILQMNLLHFPQNSHLYREGITGEMFETAGRYRSSRRVEKLTKVSLQFIQFVTLNLSITNVIKTLFQTVLFILFIYV